MAQSATNPSPGPAAGGASADPAPGATAAAVPQFTLTGPSAPNNCVTAGTDPLQWVLNVTDSGPSHLRFVALAHQDDQPGCDATIKNPRTRIELTGNTSYTPHSSGQTIMTFDPKMYNCGRVQVDVSIFDAQGQEILIVALVLDYGSVCTPPNESLTCTPPSQASSTGPPASFGFSAAGGNGSYSWSAPSASPATGTGASFSTTYSTSGTFVATVTSAGQSATCVVTIPPPLSTPQCLPLSQTVAINQLATLFGTGGSGYTWSAPLGTTATGTGSPFTTAYAAPGSYNVTMTSGGTTSVCQVIVPPTPPPLVCAPPTQTVAINALATVTAAGGTGTYSWSAPGGSTSAGSGGLFSTSYPSAGTNTVTVTSGDQTATCEVIVPPTPPQLVCAPPTQTTQIGQLANVSATGGTGTYSWSAPGGSTPTGSGAAFSTSYASAGTNTITVTSGAQTATCEVVVPPPPPQLVCAPPTQTAQIGQLANVSATGGTGTYSWSAPGGSTPTGSGAAFSTSYASAGTNTITVTSGAQTATCLVMVPPSTLSCAGVTATITDVTPATGAAQIVVPTGQLANIRVDVLNHQTGVITQNPFPGVVSTSTVTFPLPCFPKVGVYCVPSAGGPILLVFADGVNSCAAGLTTE